MSRKLPESRKLSPQNASRIIQKLIDDARVIPGEKWDSPKRQGWIDTSRAALERSGVSTSLSESFQAAQALGFSGNTTAEELRLMMNSNLAQMAGVLQSALNELKWDLGEEEPIATMNKSIPAVLVFISHSSKDAPLATALIELLRAGLGLRAEDIRCSSVDGYRLPGGAIAEQQLRKEVNTAKAFVGLITKESLASPYVMFELGARWGAELHMVPVLAGVDPNYVKGPLAAINALSCSSEAQIYQLLADIGAELSLTVGPPAANVAYVKKLAELCR